METFFELVLSVLGAFGGALLGSKKFVKEKTWEAKYKAYQEIVEAIHKISFWAEQHYAEFHFMPSVAAQRFRELANEYEAAREQLWRYAAIGELLISEDVTEEVDALRGKIDAAAFQYELARDPENERHEFEYHCQQISRAVSEHLPAIIRLAKVDLAAGSIEGVKRTVAKWKERASVEETGELAPGGGEPEITPADEAYRLRPSEKEREGSSSAQNWAASRSSKEDD
jgi:hypothetical protein